MQLMNIPVGTMVHNIEMKPGKGGQIARSAGGYAQIMGREDKYVIMRLPSGEMRKILGVCIATIGVVGNEDFINMVVGKAGRSRHLGIRPQTRGSAMNPIDHPHGGGKVKLTLVDILLLHGVCQLKVIKLERKKLVTN